MWKEKSKDCHSPWPVPYTMLLKKTIFISSHRIVDFPPKAVTIEKMLKYQSSTYTYFCWYSRNLLWKSMHFGASTYFLRLTARTMTKISLNRPLGVCQRQSPDLDGNDLVHPNAGNA